MIPDHLAALFAQEALPWNEGEAWEIDSFLKAFTLHDSLWLGLRFDVAWEGSATAAIAFDPIWNKIGEPATSSCAEWPTLFIRFPDTRRISKENYADIGGVQRGISEAGTRLTEEGVVETTISDHYGGRISIRHAPRISTLCYSARGDLMRLRKRTVEPGAAPNVGPATRPGNSGITEGPPSVN